MVLRPAACAVLAERRLGVVWVQTCPPACSLPDTRRSLFFVDGGHNIHRRVSYSQDAHLFHVVVSNGIVYLCMADDVSPARIALLAFPLPSQRRTDAISF